jgi:hypothetical protein
VSNNIFGSTAFNEAIQLVHQQEQMTRYRLEATWNKFFPAVMPREIILNPNEPSYEWINDPNFGEIIDEVFEIGNFIPFLESVQQFLSIKVVFDAVMLNFSSYHSSANPTDYSDDLRGSYIKKHPLYIKHSGQILCFQIYMDEVEVSNPLGSKKGKHKICVFYWTLLNIPPIFRSSLRSIQLLGIVSNMTS